MSPWFFIRGGKCCRLPILRTVQEYFWCTPWQGQTRYVWTGQTVESGLRCWAQHLTMIWVGWATTSPLYSYVRGLYWTDWHVTFHVHLFGGPGETHTHLSLTRISFNGHKIHFGVLCKPLFPTFISSFCSSESSTLLPVVLPLGWAKRLTANLFVVRDWISVQEAYYSMWSLIFPTYLQMVIALFPTKTNLWFYVLVLHLGSVKGKALKNLSDYPSSR